MSTECKCDYSGNEPSPTGLGFCAKCHPEGTRGTGKDGSVWVVKVQDGKNVWVKMSKKALYKCVNGKCEKQPQHFTITRDQSLPDLKPGDIVTTPKATFIMTKDKPIKLYKDPNNEYVIPEPIIKEHGLFYWDSIAKSVGLAEPHHIQRFEELARQLKQGQIHTQGLIKEYGKLITKELTKCSERPKKSPRKVKRKSVAGRVPYEKRSMIELRQLAKSRGKKIPAHAKKSDIITILRGTNLQLPCYEGRSREQLLDAAAKKGIVGRNKMNKKELISILRR